MLMSTKIKSLLIFVTIFIFAVPAVYAISSLDFLTKAQKYIDKNCSKRSIANDVSLNCYLFYKIIDLENKINSNTSRIIALEKNPTPTPISLPSQKELKTFDDNGIELGIYVDDWTFFYLPLQRFIRIDQGTRRMVTDNIFYSDENCNGNAYLGAGDMRGLNSVLTSGDSKFYINELNDHPVPVALKSYTSTQGICSNLTAVRDYWLLKPITLPLSFPIATPLHYKYE